MWIHEAVKLAAERGDCITRKLAIDLGDLGTEEENE